MKECDAAENCGRWRGDIERYRSKAVVSSLWQAGFIF